MISGVKIVQITVNNVWRAKRFWNSPDGIWSCVENEPKQRHGRDVTGLTSVAHLLWVWMAPSWSFQSHPLTLGRWPLTYWSHRHLMLSLNIRLLMLVCSLMNISMWFLDLSLVVLVQRSFSSCFVTLFYCYSYSSPWFSVYISALTC